MIFSASKRACRLLAAAALVGAGLLTGGCNRLSSQAKQMTGNYYNPELDENVPVMELNSNGKCVIRNIRPGVLTISVSGRWNVEDDSLIAKLKPETLVVEGDSTLTGDIPPRMARKIVEFSGHSLTLEGPGGVPYVYQRRTH